MSRTLFTGKLRQGIIAALLLLGALRLLSMALYPLTDSTESRYGEIARKMLETGNWVTPQFDYGIPFWAKPPLSTWTSALGMKVFGVNEFGARLSSFLFSLGILLMVYRWGRERYGRDFALLSAAILASGGVFYVSAGAVMTDASLLWCLTLCMIAFWQAMAGRPRHWGYLFFAGLGIGLLAKGPLVGVLSFMPIGLWLLLRRVSPRTVWQRLPWISGSVLMLAIAAPWYILAETRTPGFLQYFIIGEHFNRFLVSGWTGDRYGHAHAEPLGSIWLYGLGGAAPWSLLLMMVLVQQRRALRSLFSDDDGWIAYLALWVLLPLAFFTFAHNIIPTYALPGMPAFALLMAELWQRHRARQAGDTPDSKPWLVLLMLVMPLVGVREGIVQYLHPAAGAKQSQKALVQRYLQERPDSSSPLYYFDSRYYSAEFYAAGKVHRVDTFAEVRRLVHEQRGLFLALKPGQAIYMLKVLGPHFRDLGTYGEMTLLQQVEPPPQADAGSPPGEDDTPLPEPALVTGPPAAD